MALAVRCGCVVPSAEWLDSSATAVGITQLAHAAGKFIFCPGGWQRGSSRMTLGGLVLIVAEHNGVGYDSGHGFQQRDFTNSPMSEYGPMGENYTMLRL